MQEAEVVVLMVHNLQLLELVEQAEAELEQAQILLQLLELLTQVAVVVAVVIHLQVVMEVLVALVW
jgi:hypothetical protein